jgi:hypothetical protein
MYAFAGPDHKRFKFIGCEIAFREVCLLAAQSRHIVDVEFLTKGLHDIDRGEMLSRLQARIDAVDVERYQAVLLGYARCSDGVAGLRAPAVPLVIPRAHDCITFFLGSKERYREYFDSHPGTYFRTSGWLEREFARETAGVMAKLGLDKTYEDYVKEYGRENADFIWQSIGSWQENYTRVAYIDTGVATDLGYEDRTRAEATERGWAFDRLDGDLGLLRRLLDGDWSDEEFVIVPPRGEVASRNDDRILDVIPPRGSGSAG